MKMLTAPRMERCIGCHSFSLACLFARSGYSDALLSECLYSVGYDGLADNIGKASRRIQKLRWQTRGSSRYRNGFRRLLRGNAPERLL